MFLKQGLIGYYKKLNMKITTLCPASFLCLSASVARAEVYVDIYGRSFHYNIKSNYNEENLGVGFSIGLPDTPVEIKAGIFENSFDETARWFGFKYDLLSSNNVSVGVNALHWETNNATYKRQPVTLYGHVKYHYNKHFNIAARIGRHAIVMSLQIPLTKSKLTYV